MSTFLKKWQENEGTADKRVTNQHNRKPWMHVDGVARKPHIRKKEKNMHGCRRWSRQSALPTSSIYIAGIDWTGQSTLQPSIDLVNRHCREELIGSVVITCVDYRRWPGHRHRPFLGGASSLAMFKKGGRDKQWFTWRTPPTWKSPIAKAGVMVVGTEVMVGLCKPNRQKNEKASGENRLPSSYFINQPLSLCNWPERVGSVFLIRNWSSFLCLTYVCKKFFYLWPSLLNRSPTKAL